MPEKKTKKKKASFKRIVKHKIFRKRNAFALLCLILTLVVGSLFIGSELFPVSKGIKIIGGIILLIFIGVLLINVHKKKTLKVIGSMILVISILINMVILDHFILTKQFIEKSIHDQNTYHKTTYYIIESSTSNYDENTIPKEVVTYKDIFNLNGAMKKINRKHSMKAKEFDNVLYVLEDVKNNQTIGLIDYSIYEVLVASNLVYLAADYNILYKFDVYTKKEKRPESHQHSYNIYLEGKNPANLIDFQSIITLNFQTNKMLYTMIPKNIYTSVPSKEKKSDKLGYQSIYKPTAPKESLEKLLGITIDNTITLDTKKLSNFINSLNGVEICSEKEVLTKTPSILNIYEEQGERLQIAKGCQEYEGMDAITILRDQNRSYTSNILEDLYQRVENHFLLNYRKNLDRFSNLLQSNLSKKQLKEMIKQLSDTDTKWTIEKQYLEGIEANRFVLDDSLVENVLIPTDSDIEIIQKSIKEVLK